MKKTLISKFAAMLALVGAVVFSSCGAEAETEDTLSVDKLEITFEPRDTKTVDVTVTKTAETFDVESDQTWVKITESDSKFSVSVDEFTAEASTANGGKARTATITVASGQAPAVTIAVTQNPNNDFVNVDPDKLTFEAGDTKTVDVTVTSESGSFATNCTADWVTITKASGKFTVSVKEYTDADAWANNRDDREATINVTDGTATAAVTVTQKAYPLAITVSETELLFDGESEKTVTVTNNTTDMAIVIPAEHSWITGATLNGNTLKITVSRYIGTEDRVGYVNLESDQTDNVQIKITQKPDEAPINLAGNWQFKGLLNNSSTAVDLSVTIAWREDLNGWFISPLFTTIIGPKTESGMLISVDEFNRVYFINTARFLQQISTVIGNYDLCNIAAYFKGTSKTRVPDASAEFDLTMSADGNTITFPTKYTVEGVDYNLAFGVGMRPYQNDAPQGELATATDVWREIVIERTL